MDNLVFKVLFILVNISLFSQSESSPEVNVQSIIGKMGEISTIRAQISINHEMNGVLSYKSPKNLHVKFSDGRVISSNGKVLWFYNPGNGIAGMQKLKEDGASGGLSSILRGYSEIRQMGSSVQLRYKDRYYEEIIITPDENNLLKTIKMKNKNTNEYTDIQLSGITLNLGLSAALFNFKPPASAQIVENPLNQRE